MENLESKLDFVELIPGIGVKRVINNFDFGRDTFPIKQSETFQQAYRKSFVFGMYHAISLITLSYGLYHYASKLF